MLLNQDFFLPWQESGRRHPLVTPSLVLMLPVVKRRLGPSLMHPTTPRPTSRGCPPDSCREVRMASISSILLTLTLLSSPVLRTLGPGLGGSHSMSLSTEKQSLAPPTATPTRTVCHAPSLSPAPTVSVRVKFPFCISSWSWPAAVRLSLKLFWPWVWVTSWPPAWQVLKENPRREPGSSTKLEDKEILDEPLWRSISDCSDCLGCTLLLLFKVDWLLWTEGSRRINNIENIRPRPANKRLLIITDIQHPHLTSFTLMPQLLCEQLSPTAESE